MIKRIGHAAFDVENMERSLHFYCTILGFKHAFDIKKAMGAPGSSILKCATVSLSSCSMVDRTNQAVKRSNHSNHICLEVFDIHEIANHLKANGVTVDVEPRKGKNGNYQCCGEGPRREPHRVYAA